MSDTVLRVDGVSKVFDVGGVPWSRRHLVAVDDVTMDVAAGSTVGIVGESGSGKSTLARLMLGLLRPTSGTVRFEDRDLATLSRRAMRAVRRRMQPVFQDSSSAFNPRQTVRSALLTPLEVHDVGNAQTRLERVTATLHEVGLDESFLRRHPHALSGGERQRVAIARALILEPSLIIADEPTSALDVSVQARILNLLKKVQTEHRLTYVFVSHNLGVIRYISDYIVVMYLGRVVETGPVADVFHAPRHPYTKALLESIPDPNRRRTRMVVGELPSPFQPPPGCAFHPRCPVSMEICSSDRPPLYRVASDHRSACLWHDERFERDAPGWLKTPKGSPAESTHAEARR